MRMLQGICGHTKKDCVQNDDIHERLEVALGKKLVQHRLRWFGHIQRRPPEAPVHSGVRSRTANGKKCRGRPNLTWGKYVKKDLKDWSITKELALVRREWKLAIYVLEPWSSVPLLLSSFVSFFLFIHPLPPFVCFSFLLPFPPFLFFYCPSFFLSLPFLLCFCLCCDTYPNLLETKRLLLLLLY
jgi:hypothetical protein